MFDWVTFLDERRIEYVTTGPNVAKGNVNIRCPYCVDDPSHHMGISLREKGWACWRNKSHRSKNEARLVAILLSISIEEAQRIVFGGRTISSTGIHDLVQTRLNSKPEILSGESRGRWLQLPDNFKSFGELPSSRLYYQYMKKRCYSHYEVQEISDFYDVRYCNTGPFKGRVIFPIYQDGELVTWTGRSVYRYAKIRYKTLSVDFEKAEVEGTPVAVKRTSDLLLWYDLLVDTQGERLVVVEGPFDALRMNYLGWSVGVRATSLFGKNISSIQMQLLHKLVQYYPERYLVLDQEASADALRMQMELSSLQFKVKQLPSGIKDPANISYKQLLKLFN